MKKGLGGALVLATLAFGAAACGGAAPVADAHSQGNRSGHHSAATATTKRHATATTTAPAVQGAPPTTTQAPPTTTAPALQTTPPTTVSPAPDKDATGQHGPITEPPLPAPGPGFVADKVTAIGDSVMIDYEGDLEQDIPGVDVTAVVGRWWTTGRSILEQLKSEDALGAVVIVGLGTNGPVSPTQFDSMMSVLSGASRVVFVNNRVDRTWQTSNNDVLEQGVSRYPKAVLVDWYALAVQNPAWLYTTQTHLPIDGTGAQALAALVAASA